MDDLRFLNNKPKWNEILGEIKDCWDMEGTKLPNGSEGSLSYQVIENPDQSCLAAYTIPIWGDLRDFEESEEDNYIEEWFEDVIYNNKLSIRDAVLAIDCESGYRKTIRYEDKKKTQPNS